MCCPEILDGVISAIGESLFVEPEKIKPDSEMEKDLGFDDESFWNDLLFQISKRFHLNSLTGGKRSQLVGIRQSCKTVRDLCDFVATQLSAQKQVA